MAIVDLHREDNAYWATVREYPGVFATGDDLDEVVDCLREGIELVGGPPAAPLHFEPDPAMTLNR